MASGVETGYAYSEPMESITTYSDRAGECHNILNEIDDIFDALNGGADKRIAAQPYLGLGSSLDSLVERLYNLRQTIQQLKNKIGVL